MKHYFLRNKIARAWQVADSMMSRGLNNAKIPEEIKDIRSISCHGSEELGIPPCEHRIPSRKYEGSYYCEACNCGDFMHTQLTNIDENHYSKLDYPRITCPIGMPGFTNFIPLSVEGKIDSSPKSKRQGLIEETFGVEYLKELLEDKKP